MNIFTNNKTTKKIIIVLVAFILINFCYPQNVHAAFEMEDIVAAPAKMFWAIEKGLLKLLNNMFTTGANNKLDLGVKKPDDNGRMYEIIKPKLTIDSIIKGKFLLLDANIFKDISGVENGRWFDFEGGTIKNGRIALRETIAGWYYALRNFSAVALLSVLVYIGIRMIISTIAQDKAKYKMMFKDWLVALCLLIIMHLIMIGILNVSSIICEAIATEKDIPIYDTLSQKISAILSDQGDEDDYTYTYPDTGELLTIGDAYALIIVFGGILWYTLVFLVKYLKREFTIIFLILLGPVSCITYPIDKISDGKSQAFNKWFTEFLFQVIIQPFHLLLYMALIGSAIELASANVVYAIVCFAIIIPAEKFIKEMFGFRDKLGSPLGAFAGGAIAGKAISSMFGSKDKGAAGGSAGKDNASVQDQLPPKTVDDKNMPGLGAGNGKDTPGLEDGKVPNEPPPPLSLQEQRENEIKRMEESLTPEEREDYQKRLGEKELDNLSYDDKMRAAYSAMQANGRELNNGDGPKDSNELDRGQGEKAKSGVLGRLLATHNRRAAAKWGSTNVGRRWVNRGKSLLGKTARFAVRTAGAVGGMAVGGALGMMAGKGAAGAGVGLALGSKLSGKVISGARGVANTLGDYGRALSGDESKEKAALTSFKADTSQMAKARASYMSNHSGQEPGYMALDQEMNDRFELSRYGLDDSQIDKAIAEYQNTRKELYNDGKNGITYEQADNAAIQQTAYAAELAFNQGYANKDFRNEKTMSEAVKLISQKFQANGVSASVADANARKYLTQASRMRKTEIALPAQTIDVEVPVPDVSSSLGVVNPSKNKDIIERINNVTVKLHQAGFSGGEINRIASSCKGGENEIKIIEKYEAQIKYLNDSSAQDEARITIEARSNGENATSEQVAAEMRERLILRSTFDVKSEKDITALRDLEQSEIRGKSQVEAARDFANQHRGQLNNESHMDGARQQLISDLMKAGSSSSKAAKDAENIINLAAEYNNEIISWDKK